jgi:hypothetical protein
VLRSHVHIQVKFFFEKKPPSPLSPLSLFFPFPSSFFSPLPRAMVRTESAGSILRKFGDLVFGRPHKLGQKADTIKRP